MAASGTEAICKLPQVEHSSYVNSSLVPNIISRALISLDLTAPAQTLHAYPRFIASILTALGTKYTGLEHALKLLSATVAAFSVEGNPSNVSARRSWIKSQIKFNHLIRKSYSPPKEESGANGARTRNLLRDREAL